MAVLDFCVGAVGLAGAIVALVRSHTAHMRAEKIERAVDLLVERLNGGERKES